MCPKVWGDRRSPLETVTVDHFHPHSVAFTVTVEEENNRPVGEGSQSWTSRETGDLWDKEGVLGEGLGLLGESSLDHEDISLQGLLRQCH